MTEGGVRRVPRCGPWGGRMATVPDFTESLYRISWLESVSFASTSSRLRWHCRRWPAPAPSTAIGPWAAVPFRLPARV